MAAPDLTYALVAGMSEEAILAHFAAYQIGTIALHYVPDDRRSLAICCAAMRQSPRNAAWLPSAALGAPTLLMQFVVQDGWVFGYLPHACRTAALAIAAATSDRLIVNEAWVWEDSLGEITSASEAFRSAARAAVGM